MSKKNKKDQNPPVKVETFEKLHNKKPVTRRDFLHAGLIQFAATVTLPSIYQVMSKSGIAQAQELDCSGGGNSNIVPVMTITLAGGAGLSANFVPHDEGGQLLPSYTKLGLGKGGSFAVDRAFSNNAPFAGGISQVIAGIRSVTSPSTLANAAFIGVCMRSRDDSAENKYNLDGMIAKAGRAGSILPTLGRHRNSHAFITPPNPLEVRNYANIVGALGVSGSLSKLSKTQQGNLFKMVERLNGYQARKLASSSGGTELSELIQCASASNTQLISSDDPGVSPLASPELSTVWGIDANSSTGSNDFVSAALMHNIIRGNAPTANITMGGYDYHNGTRTSGDAADGRAGAMIGRCLESFAATKTKGAIVVYTDGAVTGPLSDSPGAPWSSDNGSAGMAYLIVYDPVTPPSAKGFQLGHYTTGQAADDKFITGGTTEMAAAGIFANIMSFSGELGLVEKVLPRVFTSTDLDKVIKVA